MKPASSSAVSDSANQLPAESFGQAASDGAATSRGEPQEPVFVEAPVATPGEPPVMDMPPEPPDGEPSQRDISYAMLTVAAVAVLVAFDSTIVTTSLPRVAQALGGIELYAWVGSGYLLATAVTIPVFGRMGDLFGRKRLMLVSVLIVALCSIACGLAQSMLQLVIARTVQGIGGGMMIATAFAAPADLVPDPRRRVRWMAMLSASFAVASGIGPVLGGSVTELLGWRMAFMIVPLAALPTLYTVWRFFPDRRPGYQASVRDIDWLGGALLVVALGAPLGALQYGFSGSGHAVAGVLLLMLGVVALAALIPLEQRVRVPMLPLRVLAQRDARVINIAAVLVGAVMFILIYFGPLLLQDVLQVTPAAAGILMTPLVIGMPLGSMCNSYLFPRQTQPQRLMVAGAMLLALGCGGVMALNVGVSPNWAMLTFGLAGLGLGLLLPNLTMFMQMIAERRDVGVASALVQTTRAVGSAAGIAAVGVMVSRWSVLGGVRAGMLCCIIACVVIGWLASSVRMRNIR